MLAFMIVIPYVPVSLPLAWALTYPLHDVFERLRPFEREALFALLFVLVTLAIVATDTFLLDRARASPSDGFRNCRVSVPKMWSSHIQPTTR